MRAVAEEIAADPKYADDEPLGPDDDARARFKEFARKQLGGVSCASREASVLSQQAHQEHA